MILTSDLLGTDVQKTVNATLGEYFGPKKGTWKW